MPLGKNLISTGKLNKMNLHINTEQNTLYSTHQQTGCVIEPAYNLLTLPCTIHNAMVHLNINYAGNKRKASDSALLSAQMLTRQNAFLQEPEYQEDMKLDTGRFKQLNGKFGPFEVELFASQTNNLLPSHYTKENDCCSTEWMRLAFYGNPKYANDDIYRALDKAVSEFQKAPETTKFMFVLPKWETANRYKKFIHYFEIVEEFPKGTPRVFTIPHRSHFVKGQTDYSPDNRVYLGPLKWPVNAIFKKYTHIHWCEQSHAPTHETRAL